MFAKLCCVALLALALAEKDATLDVQKSEGDMAEKEAEMKFFEEPKEGEYPELTEEGAQMVVMAAAEAAEAIEGFDELAPAEKEVVALATSESMVNMMENFGIDSDQKLDIAAEEYKEPAKEEEEKSEETAEEPAESEAEEKTAEEDEVKSTDRNDFQYPSFGFDYPSSFGFAPISFDSLSLSPRSAQRMIFLRNLAAEQSFAPFMLMQAFRQLNMPFGPLGFARNPLFLSKFRADEAAAVESEAEPYGIFEADGELVPEIAQEIDEVAKEVFDELKAEEVEYDENFEMTPEEEEAILESMKDGMIDSLGAMMIDTEAMEEFETKAEEKASEEEKEEPEKEAEVSELDRQDFDSSSRGFSFGRRPGIGFGGRRQFFGNFFPFFARPPFFFGRGFGRFGGRGFGRGFGGRGFGGRGFGRGFSGRGFRG